MLASLPRRPARENEGDEKDALVRDFRQLREALKDEGLFDPVFWPQVLRFAEVLLVQALALYAFANGHWLLGGLLNGIFVSRNGLFMHDAGHRALFCNQKWDKYAHLFLFNFLSYASSSYWNNQHNKHHAATQELGHDTDLETLPVVAFDRFTLRRGNRAVLLWQYLYFVPAQLLLFFLWKFTHMRHALRTRNTPEIVLSTAHHVVEFYLLRSQGILGYFIYMAIGLAIGGWILAVTFAMNHTHKPVVSKFTPRNWVIRATEHTTNAAPSPFVDWITGYLNYQVEHHLFPSIPHPSLPKVAPRVKALLAKHNVEYDVRSAAECMKAVFVNLYNVPRKPLPPGAVLDEKFNAGGKKKD